jgi:hypothetical protein
VPLPGRQLLPKAGLGPSAAASFYGQAAALHVKWLTSMQCTHTGITHELVPASGLANTANISNVSNSLLSSNWSGYQISNTAEFAQSGWTIPTVVKPNPGYSTDGNYYSSTWTGIGGGFNANSGPLIQSGSSQHFSTPVSDYYFWYEVVGGSTDTGGEVRISSASMPASPGDVAGSASLWIPDPNPNNPGMGQVTLGVCNFTVGGPCANFVIHSGNYDTPTPGDTTEWIVEAPSGSGGVLPLANFDSVTFVNACWSPDDITCYTIAQGSYPAAISLKRTVFGIYQYLASPDSLNTLGNGFMDYYLQPQKWD